MLTNKIISLTHIYFSPLVTSSLYLPLRELFIDNVVLKKKMFLLRIARWVGSGSVTVKNLADPEHQLPEPPECFDEDILPRVFTFSEQILKPVVLQYNRQSYYYNERPEKSLTTSRLLVYAYSTSH
jgi:hypothetical protein